MWFDVAIHPRAQGFKKEKYLMLSLKSWLLEFFVGEGIILREKDVYLFDYEWATDKLFQEYFCLQSSFSDSESGKTIQDSFVYGDEVDCRMTVEIVWWYDIT